MSRLLVTPLIRALQKILGRDVALLNFLDSFRYPLAGEVALHIDQARRLRVPLDWALEVGILAGAAVPVLAALALVLWGGLTLRRAGTTVVRNSYSPVPSSRI